MNKEPEPTMERLAAFSAATGQILEILAGMTPAQRIVAMAGIAMRFCQHCGEPQPKLPAGPCQCWNDE